MASGIEAKEQVACRIRLTGFSSTNRLLLAAPPATMAANPPPESTQMSIANQLLKLAAKVALDRLIGDKRTDELVVLFQAWDAARDKTSELAEAKEQAADSKAVTEAVNEMVVGAERAVTDEERSSLELTVAAGIASFDEPPSEAKLWDDLLPGKMKTFVILSDDHRLTCGEPGRFFHFNWYNEGWRVRDYLGGRILHPPGARVGNEGLSLILLDMTALQVWNASTVRIHSVARFGLGFGTDETDRWRRVLMLMTEVARQGRGK